MTQPAAPPGPGPGPPHVAQRVAAVMVGFCLVVAVILLANASSLHRANPLDHPELAALGQRVRAEPTNTELVEAYRLLDAELRGRYFQRQSDYRIGGWLLLVGASVALIAARWRRPEVRPPTLEQLRDRPAATSRHRAAMSRWALAGAGGAVLVSGGWLGVGSTAEIRQILTARLALVEAHTGRPAAVPDVPHELDDGIGDQSDLAFERQWPSFRGPHGTGLAWADDAEQYPTHWDAAQGHNVLWSASIDLPGHNSPVVWGDRLFITGADERQRKLYAIDTRDGRLLWEHRVPVLPGGAPWPPEAYPDTGYAAPTGATNGRLVFAIFPNGDLIACDMHGRRVWSKALGQAENVYGYASSLTVHDDAVIVQWDHGDVNHLHALDTDTGQPLWSLEREAGASWASPIVARTGGRAQLIVVTDGATQAYDPSDGGELWRYAGPHGDIASTAVCDDDLVLVVSPAWAMFAVPTTESGEFDVQEHRWSVDNHLPEIASPLIVGATAVVIDDYGRLTGLSMADGTQRWEHRLNGLYQASPVAVGHHLYLSNLDGVTTVLDLAGDEPVVVDTATVGGPVRASPAMVRGRIYIRTEQTVYAIAEAGDE